MGAVGLGWGMDGINNIWVSELNVETREIRVSVLEDESFC